MEFITAQIRWLSGISEKCRLSDDESLSECGRQGKCENITVCFSVENGLYVEVEGRVTLSQELLDRVKAEMKRLSEQDLPLQKRSENTDEAMDHFQEQGMYDKARLFNYRRASRVNVYRLGDYDDYFYGYMVMSTRYLKYFDLQMYEEGFILRLPNKKQPKAIQPFHPQKKLFDVQQEAEKLGHKLGVFDVGTLNDTIAQGRMNDLILMQEALQERRSEISRSRFMRADASWL